MAKLRDYYEIFLQIPENGKRFAINFAMNLISDKAFFLRFFSATWNFSYFITSHIYKSYSGLQIFLSSRA